MGIVGATGAVGEEIVGCLEKRGFEVSELKLFASARSAGKVKETPMGEVTIEEFSLDAVSAVPKREEIQREFLCGRMLFSSIRVTSSPRIHHMWLVPFV